MATKDTKDTMATDNTTTNDNAAPQTIFSHFGFLKAMSVGPITELDTKRNSVQTRLLEFADMLEKLEPLADRLKTLESEGVTGKEAAEACSYLVRRDMKHLVSERALHADLRYVWAKPVSLLNNYAKPQKVNFDTLYARELAACMLEGKKIGPEYTRALEAYEGLIEGLEAMIKFDKEKKKILKETEKSIRDRPVWKCMELLGLVEVFQKKCREAKVDAAVEAMYDGRYDYQPGDGFEKGKFVLEKGGDGNAKLVMK